MQKQITIYSTTTCPYCKMLKDYLTQRDFDFTEKLIDQDEVAMGEVSKISGGFMGVPFSVITGGDGKKETVIGFDKKRIDTILGMSRT